MREGVAVAGERGVAGGAAGGSGGAGGMGAAGGGVGGGSELATLLQALGDPARLRAVEVLSRSPRRAGDLAEAVGVPAPTMSKHLRVLLAAGIGADERGARDARARGLRLRRESVVAGPAG